MICPDKEDHYYQKSKRNPEHTIATVAGRRAKSRAADQVAEQRLRKALKNPLGGNGQPLAGHLLKTIAAKQLITIDNVTPTHIFDWGTKIFLESLSYSWGSAPSLANMWKIFLDLIQTADPAMALDFARNMESPFRWCVAGYTHHLSQEYGKLPHAIFQVEICPTKEGFVSVGVQNDGSRRLMPYDRPPEFPMLVRSGSQIPNFIAPQDFKRLKKIGSKRWIAELEAGVFKLASPPLVMVTEDTLLNVAVPTGKHLDRIRKEISFLVSTSNYKPKRSAKSKSVT